MKKSCETEKHKNANFSNMETMGQSHLPLTKSSKARAFKPIEPLKIDGGLVGEICGRRAPCSLNETNKENI